MNCASPKNMKILNSPLTPTLSPRKRVEREIRNFFRNFFGTVAKSLWLSQNHKTLVAQVSSPVPGWT
jgi:hypothetical protein